MPMLKGRQLTIVEVGLALALVLMGVGIVLAVIGDAPLLALAGVLLMSTAAVVARLSWRERHQGRTDQGA